MVRGGGKDRGREGSVSIGVGRGDCKDQRERERGVKHKHTKTVSWLLVQKCRLAKVYYTDLQAGNYLLTNLGVIAALVMTCKKPFGMPMYV